MNTALRKVGLAAMVMVLLLLANATYVQVIKADDYRTDPRNRRVLLDEYARQRGQIVAGGQPVAVSTDTDDALKFQRSYPNGPAFAPVTGYFSVVYGAGGTEKSEDELLNGTDDRLFVRRLSDLITGRDPRGGNVVLTIDPRAQQAAYDGLTKKGFTGAVVALRPDTGEILAMASTPSYDPNLLAAHDPAAQRDAWGKLNKDPGQPMLNRAISAIYPPGSTFKLVDTAAALQKGFTPDSQLTAAASIQINQGTSLQNFAGTPCGPNPTASLADALARSCNTAFATLAQQVGKEALAQQADAFGIGQQDLRIPLQVTASSIGQIPDNAALAQTGIGQRDVLLSPLQNAMIAATIANGGVRMNPFLVKQLQGPDLSDLGTTSPDQANRSVPADVAATITQLMIGSENHTKGDGKIAGVVIASKTGTAEHGTDPKNTPPHGWYVAFAPADHPQVAVAVVVENGGDRGLEATGGSVAAPIGRAVIASVLQGAH
jgi:peptidoglycan glycosyltransferase